MKNGFQEGVRVSKSILGAVLIFAIAAFFCVGCIDGGKPSALTGFWVNEDDEDDKINLFKDGTGTSGDVAVSWKVENKRFVILSSEFAMSCDYYVSDSKLILIEDDGDSTVFVKRVNDVKKEKTDYDSRLTGTWIDVKDNTKIVFNSDGTGTDKDGAFKYGAVGGKIVFVQKKESVGCDYIISKDGKTMIVSNAFSAVLLKKADQ